MMINLLTIECFHVPRSNFVIGVPPFYYDCIQPLYESRTFFHTHIPDLT